VGGVGKSVTVNVGFVVVPALVVIKSSSSGSFVTVPVVVGPVKIGAVGPSGSGVVVVVVRLTVVRVVVDVVVGRVVVVEVLVDGGVVAAGIGVVDVVGGLVVEGSG
jgi:hypothetical protein